MVGSGEGNIIFEKSGQLLCKGRGKLWTTVKDYFVVETKAGEDMFEKQGGDTGGINSFGTRDENHPLCKPMVDHDQNRVRTRREGQSPGTVGCMLTLLAWQVAQSAINRWTKVIRPGHQ